MAAALEALLDLPPEIEAFVGADEPSDEHAPPMPPVDPSAGPRLAAHRASVERRRQAIKDQYQAEIDALGLWYEREMAVLDKEAQRLDLCLHAVLDGALPPDAKRKSIRLPHGVTVKRRAQHPEWHRVEGALLDWAQTNAPEYVEIVHRLRWSALKAVARPLPDGRAVMPGGEVLPTVQVIPREDAYSVTVEVDAGV